MSTEDLMRKGSGLANWETFQHLVQPIVEEFIAREHRAPKHRELRRLGYGRFVSACFHHHGGYANVLIQMGYQQAKRIRRASPKKQIERQEKKDRRFLEALRVTFPEHIRLGISPSSSAIRDVNTPLLHQMLKSTGGYFGTCQRIGLLPYKAGHRLWCEAMAVIEAWTRLRASGTWPTARACSNRLRHLRFQKAKRTWYQCFHLTNITRGTAAYLHEHGLLHESWLRQHRPDLLVRHQLYLRWLTQRSLA